MDNVRIEAQFRLLQREVALAGEAIDMLRRDHRAEIDDLRLEIEVLRRCLTIIQPAIAERFATLREQVLRETDPETT